MTVKLITVSDICDMIHKIGIENFFHELIAELNHNFSHWQEFQLMPRPAVHFDQGVIELMPTASRDYYTFKYVNGHPRNPLQNKQTVVAMGLLADIETGYPLMISEMTLLTAFRTAATAALAAQYLAKKKAKTLAIIGTGAQGEFLAWAHRVALGIKKIKYFDIDPQAMKKFATNLAGHDFELIPCADGRNAIQDADVIVTATAAKKRALILENSWINPGVHINGIGGDCPGKTELDPELLKRSKVVVEFLAQTKIEGEIQNIDLSQVHTELWEIIQGKKAGRVNEQEITIFDSVGFALEDYSILKYVYRLAAAHLLGSNINLIPEIPDPKNLFGLLR